MFKLCVLFFIASIVGSSLAQSVLHWGACSQDKGKCGTCNTANDCQCTSGWSWTSQTCMIGICMRCWQNADGSTVTQIASTGSSDCPTHDQAGAVCSALDDYHEIYSYGSSCITFGFERSMNCLAALPSNMLTMGSQHTEPQTPVVSEPAVTETADDKEQTSKSNKAAIIAGSVVGVVAAVSLIVAAAVVVVKRHRTGALDVSKNDAWSGPSQTTIDIEAINVPDVKVVPDDFV